MKKSVFMALIFSVFLAGCWKYPSDYALSFNNNIWWNIHWQKLGTVIPWTREPFDIHRMVLRGYAPFKDHEFRFYIDLADKFFYFPDVKDSMILSFDSYPRFNELTGYKYQFDTSKVYLITSSQKYHLKEIDYATGEPIDYGMKDINESYRYHLPIICEQLDGASFEISGIYQNGVELPPIQFQVFLTNDGMKLCM